MPNNSNQEKTDHEDRALAALVRALVDRGHHVQVVGHPDRVAADPLTVDALVEVDGVLWAVDHCLLSRDGRIPGARQVTEKGLQEQLEAVAASTGIALSVSYKPQTKAEVTSYVAKVVDMARAVAADGVARYDDGHTSVALLPHAEPGEVALSAFLTMTGDAQLSHQIEEGIGKALDKKLTRQLKNAKDLGYPVMLLLDGSPRPGIANDTIWATAHPETVRAAVQPHLHAHPSIVDLLWWIPWGAETAQLVVGELPLHV